MKTINQKKVQSTRYNVQLILVAVLLATANCLLPTFSFSQCSPMIKIDGNQIIADENNVYGIKLPAWLKTGQTLERGNNVFSISVIEFTVNGTALDYSQNLSITTPVATVPAGKIWKIESVLKDALVLPPATATYTTAGTFTYVPTCSGVYSVKVWGAGGGGGAGCSCCCAGNGGGGGGGGYAEGSFLLSAGTSYTATVGAGGTGGGGNCTNGVAGGSSSVSLISISATGGAQGNNGGPGTGGAGGTGSGGQLNVTGQAGTNGSGSFGVSGKGGDCANGGAGGPGVSNGGTGTAGTAPGGGGGGGAWYNTGCGGVGGFGAAGATGKVEISIGGGTGGGGGGSSASRDRLQVSGSVNVGVTTTCQYIVPQGKIFRLDAVTTTTNAQTLYMGTSCGSNNRGQMTIYNPISGQDGGTTVLKWPYPQWYGAGTYFYYTSGTAYLQGLEFVIE